MDDINKTNREFNGTSSLRANIDESHGNNDKHSSIVQSSKLLSSFRKGKTGPQVEKQKKKCRNQFCHFDQCFLIKMTWFYCNFTFHRFIELIFQCDKCKKKIYILMQKSQRGKELFVIKEKFNKWWLSLLAFNWEYIPKSKINYNYCEQCFDEASGDWTLFNNNCKDFAIFIWRKIKNKDKN